MGAINCGPGKCIHLSYLDTRMMYRETYRNPLKTFYYRGLTIEKSEGNVFGRKVRRKRKIYTLQSGFQQRTKFVYPVVWIKI